MVAETKRRPALATLSAASMPIEEENLSDWELPNVKPPTDSPFVDTQLPDFKPTPGLATLSNASLAVESPTGVSIDDIDPTTPIHELASQGTSFFDSEFETSGANIRIAPIAPQMSDMDDFDYDDDDYSESEIDDLDDFYSSPKPIDPPANQVDPEPFIRHQNVEPIKRKGNVIISIIMVVLFVAIMGLVIEAVGK